MTKPESDPLTRLRRIGEEASSGVWTARLTEDDKHLGPMGATVCTEVEAFKIDGSQPRRIKAEILRASGYVPVHRDQQDADMLFCATARNLWPSLLDVVEAAKDLTFCAFENAGHGRMELNASKETWDLLTKALSALERLSSDNGQSPEADTAPDTREGE